MTQNLIKDINFNVVANPEEMSVDESMIFYDDIKNGYIYALQDLAFKPDEFEKFITDIKDHNWQNKLEEYDYSRNKNTIYKVFMNKDVKIYIRGNSINLFGSVHAQSEKINNKVWKIYNKHSVQENDVDIFMTSYFMNNNMLSEGTKHMKIDDFKYVSEMYYPYIDTQIMFDQFFTGSENILILVGKPGLGKSKMSTLAIKHAYYNTDTLPYDKQEINEAIDSQYINVAYVKSTDVLINDKFWRGLSSSNIDFVIIDDLDYMLTKRDAEVMTMDDAKKNDFLNQFLSFTDGVEKFKTKFIITTNQSYEDIDKALLRKGRLFDILELRQLDRNEALVIWKDNNLKENDFNELFDDQVLPADLGSEINKRLNDRITTATESYLKEDNISRVQKASRAKKIGL